MHTDPSSTSTSEERPHDGAARKPTPVGLLGVTLSDLADREAPPLKPASARRWRFAKYAMAVVLPVSAMVAAHRLTEPEGLDIEALPIESSAPEGALPARATREEGPPPHAFASGSFGHSNSVRVRLVLPNAPVVLPLVISGATTQLQTQWIGFDGKGNEPLMPWPDGGALRAPSRPGAFWLVLSRGGIADTVADLALLVEHPMPNKMATGINGYHMGRWPKAADGVVPVGFVEVTERTSDFPLSPHLRMSDFVVHDRQDVFPKYLHVREALLDKIELTVSEVAQMRGRSPSAVKLNVASGFRSPAHNGELSGTAQDSRHMYGDAADIAIDANDDGKLTEIDARLVAAAAEVVEQKYPDLVGGIGLYITTDGAGWPYVHLDVRGHRARWRGGVRRGMTVVSRSVTASFAQIKAAVEASERVSASTRSDAALRTKRTPVAAATPQPTGVRP